MVTDDSRTTNNATSYFDASPDLDLAQKLRLFINGENLTGVRQTRRDPILRPDRAIDGRWTVDAWAPLDGRVINGGVRVQF